MRLELDTQDLTDTDRRVLAVLSYKDVPAEPTPTPEEPAEPAKNLGLKSAKDAILSILERTDEGFKAFELVQEINNSDAAVYTALSVLMKEGKIEKSTTRPITYFAKGNAAKEIVKMMPKKVSFMG